MNDKNKKIIEEDIDFLRDLKNDIDDYNFEDIDTLYYTKRDNNVYVYYIEDNILNKNSMDYALILVQF